MCGAGTYIRACIGISGQQFLLVTAVVCWWRHLLLGCDTISSTCCRRDSVVGVSISFIFVITSLQKNCKKLYKITINGKRRQKITEEITKKNSKINYPFVNTHSPHSRVHWNRLLAYFRCTSSHNSSNLFRWLWLKNKDKNTIGIHSREKKVTFMCHSAELTWVST